MVGGAVVGSKDVLGPVAFYQNAAGGVPGPFDSFLTLRGLKTLAVRMERHCANAAELAAWLRPTRRSRRSTTPAWRTTPATPWRLGRCGDFGGMISLRLQRRGRGGAAVPDAD